MAKNERKGQPKAPNKGGKLSRLVRRDAVFNCDPKDLVHVDWSGEWRPGSAGTVTD